MLSEQRITQLQTKIMKAHVEADKNGTWDFPKNNPPKTAEEMVEALKNGKTVWYVHDQIKYRFCSITSLIINSTFENETRSLLADMRKGYKTLLNKWKIQ